MRSKKQEIPIFFTIDDGYAPFLSVAIVSLIKNASREYTYKIHIVHDGLSAKNKECLQALAQEGFAIELIQMQDTLECITDREENRLRCDYFTLTIYFRLFLPEMFPQYDKGIYLDSDIVVPGDIAVLYRTVLDEKTLVGGCIDHSVENVPEIVNYFAYATGVRQSEYINSGILLMNFKLMREKEFSRKFLELLNTWHFFSICPDQDYLNAMCHGKILYLDEKWDVMPNKDRTLYEAPQIIHYNLFDKPWCYDGIQYEEYFWKYAADSPYYEELRAFKRNYDGKRRDAGKLKNLIQKAAAGPKEQVTFRKMYERGVRIRV